MHLADPARQSHLVSRRAGAGFLPRVPPAPERPGLPVPEGGSANRAEHALARLSGASLPVRLAARDAAAGLAVRTAGPAHPLAGRGGAGGWQPLAAPRHGLLDLPGAGAARGAGNLVPGAAAALGRRLHYRLDVRQPARPQRQPDPAGRRAQPALRSARAPLEGHPGERRSPPDRATDAADERRPAGRRGQRGRPSRLLAAAGRHPAGPQRGGDPDGELRRPLRRRPGRAGRHHAELRPAGAGGAAVHPLLLQRHPHPPGHVRHHGLFPQPARFRIPDADARGRPALFRTAATARRAGLRQPVRLQRRLRLGQSVGLFRQPGDEAFHRPP